MRVQESLYSLVPSHYRTKENDEHHSNPGEIFHPPITERKSPTCPNLESAKAIPSGIAVAASPKLWMVSESKATLPDKSTTTTCTSAVVKSPTKDLLTAYMPRSEETKEGSTTP